MSLPPLKRKLPQVGRKLDLSEDEGVVAVGARQCSIATCSTPVGWTPLHGSDFAASAELSCNRKVHRARLGSASGPAVASAPASAPKRPLLTSSEGGCVDSMDMTPPPLGVQQTRQKQEQLADHGQPLMWGSSCHGSKSVYCSSDFGLLDDDGAQQQQLLQEDSSTSSGKALAEEPEVEAGSSNGCCEVDGAVASEPDQSQWPELPDDILRKVLDRLPPSYLRVARLVCRQWEGAAGRLLRHLRPEAILRVGLGHRFPYLHSLDLSQCMQEVVHAAPKRLRLQSRLTDGLLGELTTLSKLRELSLRGCSSIDGTGLAQLSSLQELRILNLAYCTQLNDEGLEAVGKLPHLETLNLQGCTELSDLGLTALLCMPSLRHIICHSTITDLGLRILSGAVGLERVALQQCRAVSPARVVALLRTPSLKRVVICKCPQVTMESLCGVSNLRIVSGLSAGASALGAAGAGGAPAGLPVGAGAALAPALPQQQQQLPQQQQPQQQQQQLAHMPGMHLLLADLA